MNKNLNIETKITLNNENLIPCMGFGCYKAHDVELENAIKEAYHDGYEMFDTASFYQNEKTVGKTLKKLDITNFSEKIFLVTKIWPTEFSKPIEALDRSLKNLEVEKIDAYLIHWPGTDEKIRLKAFEALLYAQESGKIANLGVSNYMPEHLDELKREFDFIPPLNQVECHPYFYDQKIIDYCQNNKITIMSWGPLGRGKELNDAQILKIANSLSVTPAQVILRWHLQEGRIPLPKSVHAERIKQNADIFNFSLNKEQMDIIDSLIKINQQQGKNPLTYNGV